MGVVVIGSWERVVRINGEREKEDRVRECQTLSWFKKRGNSIMFHGHLDVQVK